MWWSRPGATPGTAHVLVPSPTRPPAPALARFARATARLRSRHRPTAGWWRTHHRPSRVRRRPTGSLTEIPDGISTLLRPRRSARRVVLYRDHGTTLSGFLPRAWDHLVASDEATRRHRFDIRHAVAIEAVDPPAQRCPRNSPPRREGSQPDRRTGHHMISIASQYQADAPQPSRQLSSHFRAERAE